MYTNRGHISVPNIVAYSFGFNGKLKDNEVYGEGNAYSFEYRIYDPRMGRFLSVDPLTWKYPWNSPFCFAENDVLRYIDLEGAERNTEPATVKQSDGNYTTAIDNTNSAQIFGKAQWNEELQSRPWNAPINTTSIGPGGMEGDPRVQSTDQALSMSVPGYDIIKKACKGEQITISDYVIEAIGVIPFGKLAGPFLKSGIKGFRKLAMKSADEVNTLFTNVGKNAPYKSGTQVAEFTTTESEKFVRVFSEGNEASGKWMMKESEISGLSPKEIQDKFSLPSLPTKIVDVNIPGGTRMRSGTAGKVDGWGNGGGTQFESLDIIDKGNFTNARDLK